MQGAAASKQLEPIAPADACDAHNAEEEVPRHRLVQGAAGEGSKYDRSLNEKPPPADTDKGW